MKLSEQKLKAKEFSNRWKDIGDEKSQSQKFWLDLLENVLGVKDPYTYIDFESRVKLDNTSFIDGYIEQTHVLIEQKSSSKDLSKAIKQSDGIYLSPFQQAKRYSIELPYSQRPRWIITCNFKEFYIYDMEKPSGEPEIIKLENLEDEVYRLNFIVSKEEEFIKKEIQISIEAGEIVASLYDALLMEYQNPQDKETLHALNILCVRLVFCFYAEDSGLFGHKNMFHEYLYKYKDTNPRAALISLFNILNQKEEERSPYESEDLLKFPYVNGGLFEDKGIEIPRINPNIVDIILNRASLGFDWSKISPTIFGSVFESTLNPETRRSGGMHYTSIKNIHKVIDPLFLDDLKDEFEQIKEIKQIKRKNERLDDFHKKISKLTFLDPACGSGNFLTETYISLRKLENKIIKEKMGSQIFMMDVENPIKVNLNQFYGIEINDFATTVARTALWISEDQMMKETAEIIHSNINFLPLKTYTNIIEANALNIDWNDLIKAKDLNYIMGNPPFVGHQYRSDSQKRDMNIVFKDKGFKKLDYVCAWFLKAIEYIKENNIYVAFVATNSIIQGEQAILMTKLFKNLNIIINFAYESFTWISEAFLKAAVHCTIIGFSKKEHERTEKFIFNTDMMPKKVNKINNYILDAPNVILKNRSKSPNGIPNMIKGSQPTDGGNLLLSVEEYEYFEKKYPHKKHLLKKYAGANDYIHNKTRYCLWLVDINPSEYRNIPEIIDRLENVMLMRSKSPTKSVRENAHTPYLFTQIRQPDTDYIMIPRISSEKRKYIPIGFVNKNIIASDSTYIIPSNSKLLFGILTSNVHMSWMKIIAGRLKSDFRYSPFVYNNFPWPNPSEKQKEKIEKSAEMILKARDMYPESSLADLYDDLTMPKELRKAHIINDKAVMEAYGFDWRKMTESECVGELMKLYEEIVNKSV